MRAVVGSGRQRFGGAGPTWREACFGGAPPRREDRCARNTDPVGPTYARRDGAARAGGQGATVRRRRHTAAQERDVGDINLESVGRHRQQAAGRAGARRRRPHPHRAGRQAPPPAAFARRVADELQVPSSAARRGAAGVLPQSTTKPCSSRGWSTATWSASSPRSPPASHAINPRLALPGPCASPSGPMMRATRRP